MREDGLLDVGDQANYTPTWVLYVVFGLVVVAVVGMILLVVSP